MKESGHLHFSENISPLLSEPISGVRYLKFNGTRREPTLEDIESALKEMASREPVCDEVYRQSGSTYPESSSSSTHNN